MSKRILFLLPTYSQPRFQKRVSAYKQAGYTVIVASFDRNKYLINKPTNFEFDYLGKIQDGTILRRIPALFKCWMYIFSRRKDFDYLYVFGFDLGLVATFAGARFIYEIGDVQWVNYKGYKRKVFSWLDKRILNRAKKCVITSWSFYTKVFRRLGLSQSSFFLIENKVDLSLDNLKRSQAFRSSSSVIKITYVGSLRYPSYVNRLCEAVLNNKKYELHFYGDDGGSLEIIKQFSLSCLRIKYHGPFRNPADLPKIYDQTHLNFACYETTRENERIALPNKLYESGFFGVPVMVSEGTYLAEIVRSKQLGYAIDFNDQNVVEEFFNKLSWDQLKRTHEQIVNSTNKKDFVSYDAYYPIP